MVQCFPRPQKAASSNIPPVPFWLVHNLRPVIQQIAAIDFPGYKSFYVASGRPQLVVYPNYVKLACALGRRQHACKGAGGGCPPFFFSSFTRENPALLTINAVLASRKMYLPRVFVFFH